MSTADFPALSAAFEELVDAPLEGAFDVMGAGNLLPAVVPTEIGSLRAMLAHPSPPVELLDAVFLAGQHTTTIPRAVADIIQLATLSVAMMRSGFQIPVAERTFFHALFEAALKLEWVDENTKEILDEGLAALTSAEFEDNLSKLSPAPPPGAPKSTMASVLSDIAQGRAAKAKAKHNTERSWRRRVGHLASGLTGGAVLGLFMLAVLYYVAQGQSAGGPRYEGWVENASDTLIVGWAWDSSRPNSPVKVEISDGVHPKVTVEANVLRDDLKFAGLGNGKHGFSYEIPPAHRTGRNYKVSATIAGTDTQLTVAPMPKVYARQ